MTATPRRSRSLGYRTAILLLSLAIRSAACAAGALVPVVFAAWLLGLLP